MHLDVVLCFCASSRFCGTFASGSRPPPFLCCHWPFAWFSMGAQWGPPPRERTMCTEVAAPSPRSFHYLLIQRGQVNMKKSQGGLAAGQQTSGMGNVTDTHIP